MKARILTPTGAMRTWATLLAVIVGFGLVVGFTIGYVKKVDHDAEKRNVERSQDICGIIRIIDDRQQKIVKPNPDQKVFIDELHRYRIKLDC